MLKYLFVWKHSSWNYLRNRLLTCAHKIFHGLILFYFLVLVSVRSIFPPETLMPLSKVGIFWPGQTRSGAHSQQECEVVLVRMQSLSFFLFSELSLQCAYTLKICTKAMPMQSTVYVHFSIVFNNKKKKWEKQSDSGELSWKWNIARTSCTFPWHNILLIYRNFIKLLNYWIICGIEILIGTLSRRKLFIAVWRAV